MSINEKMTAIADAIRDKTYGTAPLTLDDMATEIPKVYDQGRLDGRKAQYDDFWDKYMGYVVGGGNPNYLFAGPAWHADTFYPKHDIIPKTLATGMFQYFSWQRPPYIDLAQRLEDCGVILDTQYATSLSQTFTYCFVTRLPKISTRNVSGLIDRTFNGASQLVTIDELELKEDGSQTFNNVFGNCTALQNITITGTIGNNISFSNSSKLTAISYTGESAKEEQIEAGKNLVEFNGLYFYGGILGALKDYSTDTSGTTHTVTLNANSPAVTGVPTGFLYDIPTSKGWSVVF